jgi:hypothetical protein
MDIPASLPLFSEKGRWWWHTSFSCYVSWKRLANISCQSNWNRKDLRTEVSIIRILIRDLRWIMSDIIYLGLDLVRETGFTDLWIYRLTDYLEIFTCVLNHLYLLNTSIPDRTRQIARSMIDWCGLFVWDFPASNQRALARYPILSLIIDLGISITRFTDHPNDRARDERIDAVGLIGITRTVNVDASGPNSRLIRVIDKQCHAPVRQTNTFTMKTTRSCTACRTCIVTPGHARIFY